MSVKPPVFLQIGPGLPENFRVPSSVRWIQFEERLSESDLAILGGELRDRPEVSVRAYGHAPPKSYTDLDFLYHFPNVRNLSIGLWSLMNLGGIRAVRELDAFSFGETRTKRHSLGFLGKFPTLRKLYIDGHRKGIDVLSELRDLEDLTLRCITLPNLDLLTDLPKLRRLKLVLGGTTDLDALARLTGLRHLELTWIRGLADLSVIGKLHSLETLHLQALRNVTALPSFRDLRRLRSVYLETMKGLRDLQPLSEAPALERLTAGVPHLDPKTLRCFVGHPSLRSFMPGLGSFKRNAYAEALLGLPPRAWLPPGARERAALDVLTDRAREAQN